MRRVPWPRPSEWVSPLRYELVEVETADPRAFEADLTAPVSIDPAPLLALLPPLAKFQEVRFAEDASPPSTDDPPPSTTQELKVARCEPRGRVAAAHRVLITFSAPMTSIEDLGSTPRLEGVVDLQPAVRGTWQWDNPCTLAFLPADGRLPAATRFTLSVARSLVARDGSRLVRPFRATFETAPPALVGAYPRRTDAADVQPVFVVVFDQAVTPQDIVPCIEFRVASDVIAARVSSREPEAAVVRALKNAPPDRVVAFEAASPLPPSAKGKVVLRVGLPSAEGPLRTRRAHHFPFVTATDFRFTSSRIRGEGHPRDSWVFEFTHELDPMTDVDVVEVTPPLDALETYVSGRLLYVRGRALPSSTYSVTVSSELRDVVGRRLGGPVRRRFRVVDEEPRISAGTGDIVTLDVKGTLSLQVATLGLPSFRVRIFPVTPADWYAFVSWRRRWQGERGALPFTPAHEDVRFVDGPMNDLVSSTLDLAADLADAEHLVVGLYGVSGCGEPDSAFWVHASSIALTAFVGDDGVEVRASSLHDGSPLEGVEVDIFRKGSRAKSSRTATTGVDGLARLPRPRWGEVSRYDVVIMGRQTGKAAFLPYEYDDWPGGREKPFSGQHVISLWPIRERWRPGERVRAFGWVRRRTSTGELVQAGLTGLSWKLVRWAPYKVSQPFACGQVETASNGAFHFDIDLAPDIPTEGLHLIVSGEGVTAQTSIFISEASRPEIALDLTPSVPGLGEVSFDVSARWLAGGALTGAAVVWSAYVWDTEKLPGYSEYYVGRDLSAEGGDLSGHLDGAGQHTALLRLPSGVDGPVYVSATARVQDPNGFWWKRTTQLSVHTRDRYAAVRLPSGRRSYQDVKPGSQVFSVLVADDRGVAVPDWPVTVQLSSGKTVLCHVDLLSGAESLEVAFDVPRAGRFTITAYVRDTRGRYQSTRVDFSAGLDEDATARHEAVVRFDRERTRPKDIVRVDVEAPFAPAFGVAWVEQDGIGSMRPLCLTDGRGSFCIPVTWKHVPGLNVHAYLTGSVNGSYAFAEGCESLPVEVPKLDVVVSTAADALPVSRHAVTVDVRDEAGLGVAGAEVCLYAQDVAALGNDENFPRPAETFLVSQARPVSSNDIRRCVPQRAGLEYLWTPLGARTQDAGYDSSGSSPSSLPSGDDLPRVRDDFTAVAAFLPDLQTGADGRVTVEIDTTDSVTEWRVMAVAASGDALFGTGTATFRTRLPMALCPALPRFLTEGDRPRLEVSVHHEDDARVEVGLRAAGLEVAPTGGCSVSVAAGRPVPVDFEAVALAVARAEVQAVAWDGRHTDAARIEIPFRSLLSEECRGVSGVVGEDPIRVPLAGRTRFLEVRVGAAQLLSQARRYLALYPHACGEQVASRLFTLPPGAEADACVRRLRALQCADGSTDLWKERQAASDHAYLGVYAAHALHDAAARGVEVARRSLEAGMAWLGRVSEAPGASADREVVRAYAVWARARFGGVEATLPDRPLPAYPIDALCWWLGATRDLRLLGEIERRLRIDAGRVALDEGPRTTAYALFPSTQRQLSLLLDALVSVGTASALADRVADSLCMEQVDGHWGSTQADAWAVRALERWAAGGGGAQDDPVLEVRIGDRCATVQGEGTVEAPAGATELTLRAPGGKCRYQVLMRTTVRESGLALDRGFTVARRYVPIDDPADVVRRGPGQWVVRHRARVRVEVVLSHASDRHHVSLVDPLPAAFEIKGWSHAWDHVAPRLQALEAFTTVLRSGDNAFNYTCIARLRGRFLAPSTRVEEMYCPHVWGCGRHDWVEVT